MSMSLVYKATVLLDTTRIMLLHIRVTIWLIGFRSLKTLDKGKGNFKLIAF